MHGFIGALAGIVACLISCDEDHGHSPSTTQAIAGLVRSERYSALSFELDFVEGAAPSEAVRAQVATAVDGLIDKPDGVRVVTDQSLPSRGVDHAWSKPELQELAKQTADLKPEPRTAQVHVLAVDGHAESDTAEFRTLGLSWGNDTIVLFTSTITRMCSEGVLKHSTVSEFCAQSHGLIWLHEFGHLLGLVNLGLPMQTSHEDPEHPGHDANPDCIMYWLFHRADAISKLRARFNAGNVQPLGFDQPCTDDLEALRSAP